MATNQWTVTKQMMSDTGTFGGGAANPGDSHIPLGKWDPGTGLTWVTRALLYAPINFSGMTAINSARLYLYAHTASGWHANGTGTNDLRIRRKTADWSETSHGSSSSVDELWGGNGSTLVVNNSTFDGDNDQAVSSDLANGALTFVDITNTVKAWWSGNPNYGVKIEAAAESSAADAFEFYSRHVSGVQPYIWIDYSTNTAPNAPVNLNPTGSTILHGGTSFTATGERSDPDAGDYISSYRVQWYLDDGTSLIGDTGQYAPGGTPTTFAHGFNVGGYGANRYYKWRAMTWDKAGAGSPWSALQRVKLNSVPNVPGSLSVATNTLTPFLSGSASDPDPGDGMTAVAIEVARQSDGVLMWNSGDLAASGSSWSKQYSGSALSWSVQYRFRARIKDTNGAYSSWSGWTYWTTSQPTGPTQSPRTTTAGAPDGGKLNDTTPDLTITYTENFTDHEVYVYSNAAGTTQVFSDLPSAYTGTTSKVITVSPALNNGATYYWKARVFIASTATWSQWAGFVSGQSGTLASAFYINALPTAPTNLVARNDATAIPVTRDTDGVYIVTTVTPLLEATYNDPDLGTYGDEPSARSIEIYNDSTSALVHSNENLSPTFTIPMGYAVPAATLAFETTYKMRWRFQDNSDTYGAWSEYVRFKATEVSTLTGVTPTGTVTSPTFTCAWTHGSPGGKSQGKCRVKITRDSDDQLMFDSGLITTSTESLDLAPGNLVNGTNYTITVEAVDTDGV